MFQQQKQIISIRDDQWYDSINENRQLTNKYHYETNKRKKEEEKRSIANNSINILKLKLLRKMINDKLKLLREENNH